MWRTFAWPAAWAGLGAAVGGVVITHGAPTLETWAAMTGAATWAALMHGVRA